MPTGEDARKRVLSQIDDYVRFTYRRKLFREVKVRRKLMRQTVAKAGQSQSHSNDDERFLSTVMEELGVDELFSAQIDDVEAEEDSSSEGEHITDESSDDEGPEDADHFRHRWPQRPPQPDESPTMSVPPELDAVAEMVPIFVELMRPALSIRNPVG